MHDNSNAILQNVLVVQCIYNYMQTECSLACTYLHMLIILVKGQNVFIAIWCPDMINFSIYVRAKNSHKKQYRYSSIMM